MLDSARIRRLLLGTVTTGAVLAAAFAGCGLPTSGSMPQACSADLQCDDHNPCTHDACGTDGLCVVEARDGNVLPQKKGDCQHDECKGGRVTHLPDDNDLPDDGNACTTDTCSGGMVSHTDLAQGAACAVGSGAGTCAPGGGGKIGCVVECDATNAGTKCDDSNGCTSDKCNLTSGHCEHTALDGVPMAADQQTAGDCKVKVCELGAVKEEHDNLDVPIDMNPCTIDRCNAGDPSNPPELLGFNCSNDPKLPGVCDGGGKCNQCNVPGDCKNLPADDDCQKRICTNGVCGQTFAAVDTPLNATLQTPGDCKVKVCDGKGGSGKVNDDDKDLPTPVECDIPTCTMGSPGFTHKVVNTACGAMGKLYCDGLGKCVGCTLDNQCPADTNCADNFCDAATKTCKVNNAANGSLGTPPLGQTAGDCQQVQCNGMGGTKSVADNNDLPANTCKTCTAGAIANKGINTSCNMTMFCDGNGTCVQCNNVGQCPAPPDCKTEACTMNACVSGNVANGVAAITQTSGDCLKNVCDGNGNINGTPVIDDTDVPSNACQTCSMGSIVPRAINTTVANKCDAATGCANKGCACDGASSCKSVNGATCAAGGTCVSTFCADGVCCNGACGAACSKCNVMGMVGTCVANAVTNATDAGACDAATGCATKPCTCDAGGACKSSNGAACMMGTTCSSTFCADNTCCNAACNGKCVSCNQAMLAGTCSTLKNAQDPGTCDDMNGMCNATDKCTCDNGGSCKAKLGELCTMDAQCASGHCADGVCCNTACTAACSQCDATGTCQANAVTGAVDVGTCDTATVAGTCQGIPCICDAAGACSGDKTAPCTMNAHCASAMCNMVTMLCK